MLRSYLPSFTYSDSILTSIKPKWVLGIFIAPVVVYLLARWFETELTHFLITFFPDEPDKSFGFYRDLLRLWSNEFLWMTFLLLTVWMMLAYDRFARAGKVVENCVLARSGAYAAIVMGMTLVASILVANFTLQSFPNSADEYVYLYQAETLSNGTLTHPAPSLEGFFHFNHIIENQGVKVGRFPPGWPLLLSVAFFTGLPPVWVNPVLGFITLLLFYSFVNRYYGRRTAVWSLPCLAFTGYFIFQSASYFSHTSCLLFTLAFVYCVRLYQQKGKGGYAILAGAFIGMVLLTRYYTAVLIFLPILISILFRDGWQGVRPLLLMGLGSLPFLLFLFWYNHQITGNGFLPVTAWADKTETLGFVKGHSVLKGLEHGVRRILLFFYWSSPTLLVLYFAFLYKKLRRSAERTLNPEEYFMAFLLAGYFFYHHLGGNQYGPRFLFEAYPFVVVFVVDRTLKSQSKWPYALLVAGMAYAVIRLPYIVQREHLVVKERLDLYTNVEQANLSNAVVLIGSHTGIIRPMPPSDLVRNGMNDAPQVIYALDRGPENAELIEYYHDRIIYRYVRDPNKVTGELIKMR